MEVKVIKTNNKHNSIQNKKLNNKGFSLVAVMVASVLGLIVFSGITTMQVTTMKSLNKAELRFNTLEVTKDILNTLRTPFPDPCSAPNCKTGCTNTLFGKLATTTADVDITTIKSHSDTTPTPDISAQTDFEVKDPIEELPDYKKILLDSIKFEGKGDKGTLKIFYRLESSSGFKIPIPSPLNIKILTTDDKGTTADTTDDTIETCEVVSLGGGGGKGADCYKVEGQTTIVGCDEDGNTTGASAHNTSTFFGYEAGKSAQSDAEYNTFIGFRAGKDITTGDDNIFIGSLAGWKNKTGSYNIALGSAAGFSNDTGAGNVFLGYTAGSSNRTGHNNVFIGRQSGASNTGGGANISIGLFSGANNMGDNNIYIGRSADGVSNKDNQLQIGQWIKGAIATEGTGDSAVDKQKTLTLLSSLSANKTSDAEVVVEGSLRCTGTPCGGVCHEVNEQGKTIIGCKDGSKEATGATSTPNTSTFFGYESGKVTTATENTFIGYKAGTLNTTGYSNTFVGHEAGRKVSAAKHWNAYFGSLAGADATGDHNTYIGSHSGYGSTTTDDGTKVDNSGSHNTFVGVNTGRYNTTGGENVFIGSFTGYKNTEGGFNTFIGSQAGHEATSSINTFIGYQAGQHATTGSRNTFIGYQAGKGDSVTKNTASHNTYIGDQAGHNSSTGGSNTFIGFQAGDNNTTGHNNTYIGYGAQLVKDRHYQLQIGDWIKGEVDSSSKQEKLTLLSVAAAAKTADAEVRVRGNLKVLGKIAQCNAGFGNCSDIHPARASSRVYKQNISPFEDYESSLGVIRDTPLFNYQYKKNYIFYDTEVGHTRMGVISEELPVGLQIKEEGKPSVPDWVSVYGTLWAGIKALILRTEEIDKLKQEVEALRRDLESLKKQNS